MFEVPLRLRLPLIVTLPSNTPAGPPPVFVPYIPGPEHSPTPYTPAVVLPLPYTPVPTGVLTMAVLPKPAMPVLPEPTTPLILPKADTPVSLLVAETPV